MQANLVHKKQWDGLEENRAVTPQVIFMEIDPAVPIGISTQKSILPNHWSCIAAGGAKMNYQKLHMAEFKDIFCPMERKIRSMASSTTGRTMQNSFIPQMVIIQRQSAGSLLIN